MLRILKRFACLCMAVVIVASLAGCKKEQVTVNASETITVYSTFYPIHALTELVVKDVEGVRAMCLVQPQDGCLRNYQLSDWDLAMLLRSADAVIAGGRGLESFESVLHSLGESGPAASMLLYNMELKVSDAKGIPDGETSHWDDENPHIYMSVDGAVTLVERISAAMQEFDPKFSETYVANYTAAKERLAALKEQILDISGDVSGVKAALLNEALVYFADNFELDAVLCYHRESGEDIDNTAELIESIKDSSAEVVLIEKQAPYALIKALEDAGLAVAKIDIMSAHPASDGCEGYFSAQISNATNLKTAVDTAWKIMED